ncbi:MAG: sugar ABC transporter substrate-binding protein [Chloroflexales bacterium]|nr:sugar ABC transporter substrate-binding protein [Chloroflexales bacterium]
MRHKSLTLAVLLLLASLILAACGSSPTAAPADTSSNDSASAPTTNSDAAPSNDSASAPSADGKMAILLPETKTARYESQDLPNFRNKLQELGFDVENNLIYLNANQDAANQQSQAEAALTNGAKILVLDPVDSDSASVIADMAKSQNVPVISYDRLTKGSDGVNYYISFDNEKVGQLQGQALFDALAGKENPTVVMINGSPTDNNASMFKQGAHSVLDGKVNIAKEYDTPDWSPDKAQDQMTQALTALSNQVDGVLAANDGTAGGSIAAMKAAGVNPLPPVTGQDAELAAIQRIILGEQYMTVYKAIKPEAEVAAELAYLLLTGAEVPADMINGSVNNGVIDVPSILLTPIVVTKDNIKDTVVADGFWTVEQICTAEYAQACTDAGLQ